MNTLGAGGEVDFQKTEKMKLSKRQLPFKAPLPELRIERQVSTSSAHERNMRRWEREIGIMGRKNKGRGWPIVFDMFHITYVGDKDMKTMLYSSRPHLFNKRPALLSYMEGFADEYRQMVRERGQSVIEQQNLLLATRLDSTIHIREHEDLDEMQDIADIQEVELDDMKWWGYLDLRTKPDLEEFGNHQQRLAVVFENTDILQDEMEATRAYLRSDRLNPNLMENGFEPHMTFYRAKTSLGKVSISPPEIPLFVGFDPPIADVNRNSQPH